MKFIPSKFINPALLPLLLLGVCLALTGTSHGAEPILCECHCGQRLERRLPSPSLADDSACGLGPHPGTRWRHRACRAGDLQRSHHHQQVRDGVGPASVWLSDTKWGAKVTTANWQINGNYVDVNGFDLTSPGAGGYARLRRITNIAFVHILNNNMHDFTIEGCGSYGVITDGRANPPGPNPGGDNWIIGNVIRHAGNYNFGVYNCVTMHGIYSTGPRDIIQNNVVSGITGWGIKTERLCRRRA